MTRKTSSIVLGAAALATLVATVTPQVADAGRFGGGARGGGGFAARGGGAAVARGGGGGFAARGGSFRGMSAPTSIGSAGTRAGGARFAGGGGAVARGGGVAVAHGGGAAVARGGGAAVARGGYAGGYRGYAGGYRGGYRGYGGYRGNVNVGEVNVERNWGGGGWGCCGGWYGHPVARGAVVGTAAAATAAAIGSRTYELPSGCVQEGGYYRCGDSWYQPQYAGSAVSYVEVNPPQ